MRLQRIAEQIYCRPWLITHGAHASIRRLFESKLAASDDSDFSDFIRTRKPMEIDGAGVAHVHVFGVVGKGLAPIEKSCGNTDTDDLLGELAIASQRASKVLLHLNSPGGTVSGVPEVADYIVSMGVPVVAYVDELCASAAYWIAASADEIYCSRSANVGSIGVYIPWIDQSGLWEELGIKADPIINKEGIYKAAGFGPSLSDDQRAQWQESVDETFAEFRGHVLANRPNVPDAAMRGQMFGAKNALAATLIDGIEDYETVYKDLES